MLLHIPDVFSKDEVSRLRAILDAGPWTDGNVTSGHQSARAKNNAQDIVKNKDLIVFHVVGCEINPENAQIMVRCDMGSCVRSARAYSR